MSPELEKRLMETARNILIAAAERYEAHWKPGADDEEDAVVGPQIVLFTYKDEKKIEADVEFTVVPSSISAEIMSAPDKKSGLAKTIYEFLADDMNVAAFVLSEAWGSGEVSDKELKQVKEGVIRVKDTAGARTVLLVQVHTADGTKLLIQKLKNGKRDGEIVSSSEPPKGRMSMHTVAEEIRAAAH